MSAIGRRSGQVPVTAGSISLHIEAAPPIRIAQPQINTEERLVVIPWATDRRTGGSMRVKGVAGNKRARRIEVEGAYNSRAIEGGQVGNKRAQWIEVEAEIGWVIDKFPTHRADRIKAPSVAPRRGRVEARPAPAANEA